MNKTNEISEEYLEVLLAGPKCDCKSRSARRRRTDQWHSVKATVSKNDQGVGSRPRVRYDFISALQGVIIILAR